MERNEIKTSPGPDFELVEARGILPRAFNDQWQSCIARREERLELQTVAEAY